MNPVVVFAAGNDARGDDALGPQLLAWIEAQGWAHVRTVFDFQFQVEHALELDGAALALFIDAHADLPAPLRFEALGAPEPPAPGTHALSPAQVMAVHAQVSDAVPPPAFVLAVAGVDFGLGAPMSAQAAAAAEAAQRLLAQLLDAPGRAAWERLAGR
jgi:hydrogenase maturation protease